MIDRLKKPIPFPDSVAGNVLIAKEVESLTERRNAFNEIASLGIFPQWPKIRFALEQVINQYTEALLVAKGDDVIRLQEAVKAYRFLVGMPDTAQESIVEIDRAIQSLGRQVDAPGAHIDENMGTI